MFALILTLGLVVLLAVTLDLGSVRVAQSEMRRNADAAAMAACWELFDKQQVGVTDSVSLRDHAWGAANEVSAHNMVRLTTPQLLRADVRVGQYDSSTGQVDTFAASQNAVNVTVRRDSTVNDELPLSLGSATGRHSQALIASATAAMFSSISGFTEPEDGGTIGIMPFALDLPSWEAAVAGATSDNYMMQDGAVQNGSDGVFEVNLYPLGTGSPGNRGTVDIGSSNNSTNDIARQILHGVSQQDLLELGKPLELDANGELGLEGDTGISAGLKDELATLIGETRIIPIFYVRSRQRQQRRLHDRSL